jgi:hypothetical protein
MKLIELYEQEIKKIETEIEALKTMRTASIRAMIKDHCQINIGDKVVINGYSYQGKTMKVESVWFNSFGDNVANFEAAGQVIRKDGSPGEQQGRWRSNGSRPTLSNAKPGMQ